MAVITMSRQIGSGAEEVAERVAGALSLRPFDKTLMLRVAAEAGISESMIVDYSEEEYQARNFFERLFGRQRPVASVTTRARGSLGAEQISTEVLNEDRAIDLIRATMRAACERGNVLILGRGGQAILEDEPGVLHVRVVTPLEERVRRLQQEEGLTAPQARRLASGRDRTAAEYLHTFHHIDWDDPTLYHLVVNIGKLGVDAAVELILAAARGMDKGVDPSSE